MAVLHDARRFAEDAGAALEKQLAERSLRRLGVRTWGRGRADPLREGFDSLTEREKEIAGLIRDGATNPQIAQALFLSRKTVERHVSNIFLKLGVKNRTEAANLNAKTFKRAGRGYRNHDNYRSRIMAYAPTQVAA
jgi:DNA-binding NarL/FixJ family response regulator